MDKCLESERDLWEPLEVSTEFVPSGDLGDVYYPLSFKIADCDSGTGLLPYPDEIQHTYILSVSRSSACL